MCPLSFVNAFGEKSLGAPSVRTCGAQAKHDVNTINTTFGLKRAGRPLQRSSGSSGYQSRCGLEARDHSPLKDTTHGKDFSHSFQPQAVLFRCFNEAQVINDL